MAISALVLSLVLAGCLGSTDQQESTQPAVDASVPVVLVLDGSGSMRTDDVPGTRIGAARRAAHLLIDALPEGTPLGVVTYGTQSTGTGGAAKGCQDVTTVHDLAPVDGAAAKANIDQIAPPGLDADRPGDPESRGSPGRRERSRHDRGDQRWGEQVHPTPV